MKKYVKPRVRLIFVESATILAGSLDVKDIPTNSMLSKRGSFYDLDEEEEY